MGLEDDLLKIFKSWVEINNPAMSNGATEKPNFIRELMDQLELDSFDVHEEWTKFNIWGNQIGDGIYGVRRRDDCAKEGWSDAETSTRLPSKDRRQNENHSGSNSNTSSDTISRTAAEGNHDLLGFTTHGPRSKTTPRMAAEATETRTSNSTPSLICYLSHVWSSRTCQLLLHQALLF